MPKTALGVLPGVFSDEDVKILSTAFEEAWAEVAVRHRLAGEAAEDARDLLGKFIVKRAMDGERSPSVLRDEAVAYLDRKQNARPPIHR